MSNALVDNISNASGSMTTPTEYVVRGSAKVWAAWDSITPSLSNSLNISSYTDTATGRGDFAFTNAFSDTSYTSVFGGQGASLTSTVALVTWNSSGTKSNTVFSVVAYRVSDFSFTDFSTLSSAFHGDLA